LNGLGVFFSRVFWEEEFTKVMEIIYSKTEIEDNPEGAYGTFEGG
jgi:hypothetical protein